MDNIKVGRYDSKGSESHGYAGWVEPEDLSWILFVRNDHTVQVFLDRDSETGAIIEEPNLD